MMEEAARAWLGALDDEQRRRALFPFTAPERRDWHYIPRQRPGLPLGQQTETQQARLWALVDSILSEAGRGKARGVTHVEGILGALENRPRFRDPANYALIIFGEPRPGTAWAWRFEGHHLSLNVTRAATGAIALSPGFFGSNPGTVPEPHPQAGFELLRDLREQGFALLHALEGHAREQALIRDQSFGDILAGPGREHLPDAITGIAFGELGEGRRAAFWRLVQGFLGHLETGLRAREEAKIRESGLERLHFAWAGALAPGRPHYFRIHGPRTLIEYDNSQNNANHVHTVWHDPLDVLGHDVLAHHHRLAHSQIQEQKQSGHRHG